MSYTGGLRARLISDSVYHLLYNALEARGWFNSSRPYRPITVRTEAVDNDVEIPLNTLVIHETVTRDEEAEMGSNLGEVTTTYYVDFYAENRALGKEVIHDVRDILTGRMAVIGRTETVLPVYDWTLATPALLFVCEIEDVVVDQAKDFPKPWQKHWWACRFDLVDYYNDDVDGLWMDYGGGTWRDLG